MRVGNYRVIYLVDDSAGRIEIRAIADRKEAYEP